MQELHCAVVQNSAVWADYWNGGDVDVVQAADSKGQEYRASHALKELQSGLLITEKEFEGAKWISPRTIPDARRDLVVEQFQQCMKMPGWKGENMPEYDQADKIVHELKIGEDVAWSDISRACYAVKHKGCYSKLDCEP